MELKGKIKEIQPLQTFESGFTKQVVLLETNEQYPQTLPIVFTKDKTSLLAKYKAGQEVEIGINLWGQEYNGKHYVLLVGWKIFSQSGNDVPF